MPTTKRIVCLATSRMPGGRCIAGRELVNNCPGDWVRPVSTFEHQGLSKYERQYNDGSDPRLLDIIDIPLQEHQPKDHQQENWQIKPQGGWIKVDEYSWNDLQQLSETGGTLWRNGDSTYNGSNDQIQLHHAKDETSSLKLIHVDKLSLHVFAPQKAFGNPKRRVQGWFRFGNHYYALWITDLDIEEAYRMRGDGNYNLGECYLTISLGGPNDDSYCYKLIAAVMEKPR